jgi:hypothetical protein
MHCPTAPPSSLPATRICFPRTINRTASSCMRLQFSVVFMVGRKSHACLSPPAAGASRPKCSENISFHVWTCPPFFHRREVKRWHKATHRPCLPVRTATDQPLLKTPVSMNQSGSLWHPRYDPTSKSTSLLRLRREEVFFLSFPRGAPHASIRLHILRHKYF